MSDGAIIIQIMFVTIGMLIVGMILNRLLGLRKENLKALREQAQNMQDRMRNAQLLGDPQLLMQLQQESMIFMKKMMKKQLIPMCVRCIFFIGIFVILGLIYGKYTNLLPFWFIFGRGWISVYFIFSITFSLSIYGIKRLYRKLTGKETKSQNKLRDIMGMASLSQPDSRFSSQATKTLSSSSRYQLSDPNSPIPREENQKSYNQSNSWKDRVEK